MTVKSLVNLSLDANELVQHQVETLSADPTAGGLYAGRLWFNSTSSQLKYYSGSAVIVLGTALTNPMTTQYDLIQGGAAGVPTRLAKGANNTVLAVDASGVGSYRTIVNADVSASAALALSKLAPGSSGVLKSNGTAISAGNQIVSGDITDLTIIADDIANSTITNGKLANGAAGQIVVAFFGATSTSSTSIVAMSGASLSITTTGRPVLVLVTLLAFGNTALSTNNTVELWHDGAFYDTAARSNHPAGLYVTSSFFTVDTPLSAGAHTYTLRWSTTTGTLSHAAGRLIAVEIK